MVKDCKIPGSKVHVHLGGNTESGIKQFYFNSGRCGESGKGLHMGTHRPEIVQRGAGAEQDGISCFDAGTSCKGNLQDSRTGFLRGRGVASKHIQRCKNFGVLLQVKSLSLSFDQFEKVTSTFPLPTASVRPAGSVIWPISV